VNLSSLIYELLFRLWTQLMYLIEDELHRFLHPLEDWMTDLVNRPLPPDWRQQLHAYLDEQHAEGFEIAPEHRPILENHIESWAAFRGMLPRDEFMAERPGPRDRPMGLVVVPDILDPPGDPDGRSGGSPFRLAAVTKVGAGSGVGPLTGWGEKAGAGPVPSAAFRERVQRQLDAVNHKVAIWWKSEGELRSRDAGWFGKGHYSERVKQRSIVTVHKDFTAVDAANAIIAESKDPDPNSVGQAFDAFWRGRAQFRASEVLSDQQRRAIRAAGKQAGQLASIYYESIASVTKGADVVVLVSDVAENGFSWHQFLYLLPAMAYLPKGKTTIVLRVSGKGAKGIREIRISVNLAHRLNQLSPDELKKLQKLADAATTEQEAVKILERGVKKIPEPKAPPKWDAHHIGTIENWTSTLRGGPWSQKFEEIFKRAEMRLDDVSNLVRIPGHRGPHSKAYHQEIYRRLSKATSGLVGKVCRDALIRELRLIARDIQTPGTYIYRLLYP
jgi:hypothetical protein